jgi:uncharacterized protein (UPF0332 family)
MNIHNCIKKGWLKKSNPDNELSKKELKEALYDLKSAKQSLNIEDYKWTIIKSYYAMFHAARSLLYIRGYEEKKHIGILAVLEDESKKGTIQENHINNFKAAMACREDADYGRLYSKEIALFELETAKEFLKEIKKILL